MYSTTAETTGGAVLAIIIWLVTAAISLLILYFVVKAAIVRGLRQARYEERLERGYGNDKAITWGDRAQTDALVQERKHRASEI